jgi:cell division protein FtsN
MAFVCSASVRRPRCNREQSALKMTRDAKARQHKAAGQSGHPMLIGVFIGVLVGLCLALGVALLLNRAPAPFVNRDKADSSKPAQADRSVPKFEAAKPDAPKSPEAAVAAPSGKPGEPKTRFDFYKILPGEEAVTGKELSQGAASGSSSRVVYYLQAGAFPKASDADNLKARLALAGLEAQIQTATLPDNTVWHRVRLGPYSNAPDLEKVRERLKQNKIEAAVIKVNEPLAKR